MSDVALVMSFLGSAKPAAVLSKDASGGAVRGAGVGPRLAVRSALVDEQQSDGLIAGGNFSISLYG